MSRMRRQRAFTIIELIVAIAIMSMLIFMVHQLFNATSRAISAGAKTGELLVESEAIGDQLERDAGNMLGPNRLAAGDPAEEAGFLVIVQREIPDATVNRRGTELHEGDEFGWPAIRSDILMFVTESGDGFQPITPRNGNTFGSTLSSNHGRVWYGHALRTEPDGSPGEYLGDGMNRVANYWTLGRQQLLLAPSSLDLANDTYAANANWNAAIQNTGGGTDPPMFRGFTDVTPESLDDVIQSLENGTYPADVRPLYMNGADLESLHVNPSPDMAFQSWQMAQMHGQMAGNVSDFIVEFAGDFDGTSPGKIDRDGNGNIIWYTALGFENDWSSTSFDDRRPDTRAFTPAMEGTSAPNRMHIDGLGDAVAFVWRHDDEDASDDTYQSKWPYLIRVRYRMHDGRGNVVDTVDGIENGLPGRWFEHIIKVNRPLPQ